MQDTKRVFFKVNSKIICREEEGDALLFNPEKGTIKMLNRVGYEIWKLCDGTLTFEQIIERVSDKYPDFSQGAIKKDVTNFINHMESWQP